jgi:anti-anti-sigma factor
MLKAVASYELENLEHDEAGVACVALTGELDLTNADELAERLAAIANGATGLVIDLNRLVFIDSAAIHRLFEIAREGRPGRLAFVVERGSAVAGTLEIVELGRVAPLTSSLDEARAILARAPSA